MGIFSFTKEFKEIVEQTANELRTRTYNELRSITETTCEKVNVLSRRGIICTCVDEMEEKELRVAVVGHLDCSIFRFIKEFQISGFRIDPSGNMTELTDDDIAWFD
jgi:hypothetical protein